MSKFSIPPRSFKLFFSFLIFCGFLQTSQARATVTVCASGCDYSSISAAITAATAGDVIEVSGTITESGITIDKDLTIKGESQSGTIVQAAASQATATDRVFLVNAGLTVSFEDLTIQNGNIGGTQNGGGVLVNTNSSSNLAFNRVTIANSFAGESGGGVAIVGADGTVAFNDAVIKNNEANNSGSLSDGGGIFNTGASSLELTRCTISGNSAGDDAGGFFTHLPGATVRLINCSVFDNVAGASAAVAAAGGLYLFNGATYEIISSTIVNNTLATPSSDIRGAGIYYSSAGGNLNFINSIVANNSGGPTGNDFWINSSGSISQTTSLVEDCSRQGGGACPSFSYSSDANIATSASTCGEHSYFDISGSVAENNGTPPSGNIPTNDICGNVRQSLHDIGAFDVAAAVIVPIPALNEWGLFSLLIAMLCLSLVAAYNVTRVTTLASTTEVFFTPSNILIPFDKKEYLKALNKTVKLVPIGFVLIYLGWGQIIVDDFIGMLLVIPMIAYLIFLIKLDEHLIEK